MSFISIFNLMLLAGASHQALGQGNIISNAIKDYDVGCYASLNSIIESGSFYDIFKYFLEGGYFPTCEAGGLWNPVQCNSVECYCVSITTGTKLPTQPYGNYSNEEFSNLCLQGYYGMQDKDICVQAPVPYPCEVGVFKYVYNSQTQTCEKSVNLCRGFSSQTRCNEACGFPTIRVYVLHRGYFSLKISKKDITKYQLSAVGDNFLTTSAFNRLPGVATSQNLTPRLSQLELGTRKYVTGEEILRREKTKSEVCTMEVKKGPCRAFFTRWFYNYKLSTCEKFGYGGCRPNANNFKSESDCLNYCFNYSQTRVPISEVLALG